VRRRPLGRRCHIGDRRGKAIAVLTAYASLGELLMPFMLETIVAAHLLGVDSFDRPAVEEGKVLAKKYLAGSA
jgi:glucose-6-phosphate isomerase